MEPFLRTLNNKTTYIFLWLHRYICLCTEKKITNLYLKNCMPFISFFPLFLHIQLIYLSESYIFSLCFLCFIFSTTTNMQYDIRLDLMFHWSFSHAGLNIRKCDRLYVNWLFSLNVNVLKAYSQTHCILQYSIKINNICKSN